MLSPEEQQQLQDRLNAERGCPVNVADRLAAFAMGEVTAIAYLARFVSIDKEEQEDNGET